MNIKSFKFHAVLLLFALFISFAPGGAAFAAIGGEYVEGEALVLLRNNSAAALSEASAASASVQSYAQSVAARAGAAAVTTYNALSAATGEIFVYVRSDS